MSEERMDDVNSLSPLPGEPGIPNVAQRPRVSVSKKGILAVALLVVSLVAVSAVSVQRYVNHRKDGQDGEPKAAGARPTAASGEPRRLDMAAGQAASAAPTIAASAERPTTRIPALVPTAEEAAEPIGVRRTGQAAPSSGGTKPVLPEDAPVLLVTSRPDTGSRKTAAPNDDPAEPGLSTNDPMAATTRNLQGYQRQLQGLLDTLTKTTAMANGQAAPTTVPDALAGTSGTAPTTTTAAISGGSGNGLLGGQLQRSATPRVAAALLGSRSLTLPKGTAFTCALKTKVISATSGFVGCQVQRNVYGDDGRVLLVERGSHLDGEYRVASVKPGTVRIPVLWTRIRTPNGVTVDIDSPGTGQLGESGIDGDVDNRWGERIGAAMLLSLIDDSVKLVIQAESNRGDSGSTVVLPSTTSNSSRLAEKVLDSTINIPPLISRNQGGIVGIVVGRDVDFSSVYELKPVAP